MWWALVFYAFCGASNPEYIILLPTKDTCEKTMSAVSKDSGLFGRLYNLRCYPENEIPKQPQEDYCGY